MSPYRVLPLSIILAAWAASASAEDCRGVYSKMCAPDSTTSSSDSLPFGLQPGWLGNAIKSLFSNGSGPSRDPELERAWSHNDEGVRAYKNGEFEWALNNFRRALAIRPNNRDFRYNVALALRQIAYRDLVAMGKSSDFTRLLRANQYLSEADSVNGSNKQARKLRQYAEHLQLSVSRVEREQRRYTDQRQFTDNYTPQRRAEYEKQRRLVETRLAATSSSQSTVRLNPTSGTVEAVTVATTPPGRPPTASSSALGQLQKIATGVNTICEGFEGRGCGERDTTAEAVIRQLSLPTGVPALSKDDVDRFASDPQFASSMSSLRAAQLAVREAEANVSTLRQRQAELSDSSAKQNAQTEIANAEQQLQAAKGVERIAANNVVKEIVRLKPQVIDKK